jgi:hypothetical protein
LTALALTTTRFVAFLEDLAFAALPTGRAGRRAALAPARAGRRAVFAAFFAAFRPLDRPLARELVVAAFLVPRAALRLAIACSFSGLTTTATYLDSFR